MRYKTVFQASEDSFVEKKSRFIGMAFPVETEEEVLSILERLRKEYWNATHNNVYAYSIGVARETKRFSDDGEPVHTAGMPLLNLLQGENLRNTLLVVVRFFGGTLLGTGGLVRAYSQAGRLALDQAGIIEKQSYLRYSLPMEYTLLGKMQYGLAQDGYQVEDTIYTDLVEMKVLVPETDTQTFEKRIASLSDGKIRPQAQETVLAALHQGVWHFYEPPRSEGSFA